MKDEVSTLVIENKNRLVKFSFEMFEHFFKYFGHPILEHFFKYFGRPILELNDNLDNKTYDQELTEKPDAC